MYYYIYQITNSIDNKIYIGKHKTSNLKDGYFGSGKYLKRAIDIHGKENFSKEIILEFNSEEEMNDKEKELVTEEFCLRKDTYNLCVGGQGGFSYINREYWTPESRQLHNSKISGFKKLSSEQQLSFSKLGVEKRKALLKEGKLILKEYKNKGRPLNIEHAKSISLSKIGTGSGKENSQYGKKFKWMNNSLINKRVDLKDIEIYTLQGWVSGRLKPNLIGCSSAAERGSPKPCAGSRNSSP